MQRSRLKISVIVLSLLCNGALLFGMKANNGSLVLHNKKTTYKAASYDENELKRAFDLGETYDTPQTNLPIEIIESIAACSHDSTKDCIRTTCKYLSAKASSTNVGFVSNPLFVAHESTIQRMALVNSWYNNVPMITALQKHPGGIITSDRKLGGKSLYDLNNRHNNNNPLCDKGMPRFELKVALYCAALADDTNAIKNIVPKLKELRYGYGQAEYNVTFGLNHSFYLGSSKNHQEEIMMILIKRGNREAFEFMIAEDIYLLRDLYGYVEPAKHASTFLDRLNLSKNKDVELYKAICEKYGEKTSMAWREEYRAKEEAIRQKKSNAETSTSCIIS